MTLRLTIFIAICIICNTIQAQTNPIGQANDICEKAISKNQYPGLAVAVGHNGKVLWSNGYGFANIEGQVAIDPETSMFRIGSISKTLTSAALQLLVQDGKVDLDENVRKYVNYFPEKKFPLIVKEVAGHIAGVRHYASPMEMLSNIYYPTVRGGMEIFMHDALLFEPGDKYSYSSYGWNLISAVIEEASDVDFLEYMQKQVFDAFELTNTKAEIRSKLPETIVSFYVKDGSKKHKLAPEVDNSYKWAGGGFIATAIDVLKFSHMMHHSDRIDQNLLKVFQTPLTLNNGKKTNYGLGWATNTDKKGRRWVGHSGGSVGGTSMYLYYPDYDLTVVTLVNLSSAKMDQLAWKIAEQFIPRLKEEN